MKCIKHTFAMRRATMLLLMLLTVCTTWAQDPVTLSDVTVNDIGKVVSTDGNIYATVNDVTLGYPVAMITYVDEQNHTGLAIAIDDVYYFEDSQYRGSFQWADAASAVTTWAADNAVTGGTWKVPTIQEWQQMLIGCGAEGQVSNPPSETLAYTGINEKLNSISEYSPLQYSYWTATEYSTDKAYEAYFNGTYADFFGYEKESQYGNKVRACLLFETTATSGGGGESGTTNTYVSTFEQEDITDNYGNLASNEGNNWAKQLSQGASLEYIEYENEPCIAFHTTSEYWNGTDLTPAFQISGELSTITIKAVGGISSIILNENGEANDGVFTKTEGTPFDEYTLTPASGVSLNTITIIGQGDFFLKSITVETATSGEGSDEPVVIDSDGSSINMPKTGTAEYTIAEGVTSFDIYDDGGAEGEYSSDCDGAVILTAPEGCMLQLSGTITSENGADYLVVFDGTSTGDNMLLYTYSNDNGETTDIGTVATTGESMRILFYSDDYGNYDGLNLTVTVVPPATIDGNTSSINMPYQDTEKYIIAQGVTSFNIYDNNGAESVYSSNCDGTVTLYAPEGCKLQLTGSVVTESGCDLFKVWDGSNSSGDPKVTLSGGNSEIEPIVSTGESLTLNFYSDSSVNDAGLNLTVTVVNPNATYTATIQPADNGTVTISGETTFEGKGGSAVQMYISPNSGYMIEDISAVDADNNNVSITGGKWYSDSPYANFTMPYADVTLTPSFTNARTAADGLYMNMPSTSSAMYAYIPDDVQSFKLYDDGGQNGNYSSGLNRTVVLVAPENYLLQLTGTITALTYEKLTVNDGSLYSNTKLLEVGSSADGVATDIGTINSSGRYLRVTFDTYTSKYSGLDLTVTLINSASENNITITSVNDGSVVAKIGEDVVTTAKVNDIVTLIATPIDGNHILTGITVTDANNNTVSVTGGTWYNYTATFKMPATAVTVTPVFEYFTIPDFSVNIPTSGTLEATIPENVKSFKVYDDGGKNGAYQGYTNGVLVLIAPEDRMLHLKGTVETNADSRLTVWDDNGTDDDDTKLISGACSAAGGEKKVGGVVTSDQYMTLRFDAGFNAGPWDGLDLTVTQVDVVLDDQADNSDVISQAVDKESSFNVALKGRTLYRDGGWNTICLPFSINFGSDEVTSGAELLELQEASINGTVLNLTFGEPSSGFVPNTPYIIRWNSGDDIVCPLFTGVQFVSSVGGNYDNGVSGNGRVRFIGTYKGMTFEQEDKSILLMGAGNQLFYPQPDGEQNPSLGAQRAYFKIGEDGGQQAHQLTGFSITYDGEATTGIIEAEADSSLFTIHSSLSEWYSLDGRKLQGKPTKRGVYIFNGHKLMVK